MPKKLKIFVSSYACEPNLGSEIGVGWHWVLEMSIYFDLWVLTRKSNQASIEDWIENNKKFSQINFIYYDLPKWLKFWKKGLRGVKTYYFLWQFLTDKIVKRTMLKNDIKIYHLLTYGNALWPSSSFGKKQFFIWGPTSSGDIIPREFSRHYSKKSRLIEGIRRFLSSTLKFNYFFINRCKNANLILCKTIKTLESIPNSYKNKGLLFTDVAVEPLKASRFDFSKNIKSNKKITKFLAVGRLDAWRGFDLLIEAFQLAYSKHNAIRLEILGKGNDYNRLKKLIDFHQLSEVIYLRGHVSMNEYYNKMNSCDVIVNPCLKEGAVTIAFDSMSYGKPLICIDTGGYSRYFSNDYAIVIKAIKREKTIYDIAKGMIDLTDTVLQKKIGRKSHEASKEFTWNKKGIIISNKIYEVYNNYLVRND